ncbi:MAG: hypothetical protein E5299_01145 [Burkholderia gladioli]|nr:MAG: hypothetical protein E5299_01145 [Burkholderia gladioli]
MIQTLLGVKTVYRLTLRGPARFHPKSARSGLSELSSAKLHHALSPKKRWMSNCRSCATTNQIHLVVDSSGLKVYGEGEWKGCVCQHGYSKRRTWSQVHLALNANTGQVHAALMMNQNVADGDALAKLLGQIPREEQIDVIGGALLHKSSARTQWHRRAY